MAYIGPAPKLGQNREVDDISSGFNGSTIWQINKESGFSGDSLQSYLWHDIKYDGKFIRNLHPVNGAKKSYGDKRKINWFKVYAGDEACEIYGTYNYLPQDTIEAIRHFGVAIKGPLTTPIGGGIRSLNVALRQIFDLYSCVRPCKYYSGTPSPHKNPQNLDVIVYRENTEDIYMGIEWESEDPECIKLIDQLNNEIIPPNPETLNPASIVLSTLKISPPLDSTSFKKSTISCSSES